MNPETVTILWVERIISIAIFLQTVELLQIRATYSENGVWRWSVLRQEFETFPAVLRWLFDRLLSYHGFLTLLILRLLCAGLVLFYPHPAAFLFLLFSTIIISLRWRGTFNGGSDYMTIIVLLAVSVASLFRDNPWVVFGCLWYLTVQSCSSYFISGFVKLSKRNWWTGEALGGFFCSSIYNPPAFFQSVANSRLLLIALSVSIMVFEICFPLGLLNSYVCLIIIGVAIAFHMANFFVFGLNRFLFAWAATYPALYYCSRFGL